MSVQAISWVLDFSESRLGARCVLISIANHAHKDGGGCWIKVATIAKESRLSEREVQYAVKELVEIGELEIEKGAGPKGTNVYSLSKMGANTAPLVHEGCTDPPLGVHTGSPEPSESEPIEPKAESLASIGQEWPPRAIGPIPRPEKKREKIVYRKSIRFVNENPAERGVDDGARQPIQGRRESSADKKLNTTDEAIEELFGTRRGKAS